MTAPQKSLNTYTHGDWYYPLATRPTVKQPRKKIRLAHIDTGFAWHPCVDGDFDENNTMSFYKPTRKGVGELRRPEELYKFGSLFLDHGLATGAFVIGHPYSSKSSNSSNTNTSSVTLPLNGMISNAAAFIDFIPMRVIDSVDISTADCKRLSLAINWAVDNDCSVISMSFGSMSVGAGLDSSVPILRPAFERARNKGVILCCASGQGIPYMMYPGQFSLEGLCITCGPSTKDQIPHNAGMSPFWSTFKDGYVTICAPGAQMPKACWVNTGNLIKPNYSAGMMESEGSSYSTAFVASIAALWLAQHETAIDELKRLSPEKVMDLFKLTIQQTATPFAGLPKGIARELFGPGIINPHRLLADEGASFIQKQRARSDTVRQ